MKIVKYSELVHLGEIHSQARESSPYELVQNSFRHSFNNLLLFLLFLSLLLLLLLLDNVSTRNFRMRESVIESLSE